MVICELGVHNKSAKSTRPKTDWGLRTAAARSGSLQRLDLLWGQSLATTSLGVDGDQISKLINWRYRTPLVVGRAEEEQLASAPPHQKFQIAKNIIFNIEQFQ